VARHITLQPLEGSVPHRYIQCTQVVEVRHMNNHCFSVAPHAATTL
jgi:hypothetical protein